MRFEAMIVFIQWISTVIVRRYAIKIRLFDGFAHANLTFLHIYSSYQNATQLNKFVDMLFAISRFNWLEVIDLLWILAQPPHFEMIAFLVLVYI